MSSDEIDAAFSCAHMAKHLIEENGDFIIYAPIIMNSEFLATQKDLSEIKSVAIGQNRKYLGDSIKESYDNVKSIVEINSASLQFALVTGNTDAVVLDITKLSAMRDCSFYPVRQDDYISYVLLINKRIIGTEAFDRFTECCDRVSERLGNESALISAISDYTGENFEMPSENHIKFLKIN